MNTNVANFSNYQKKFNSQVIYVGDTVEWQDYDGQNYEATVTRIEYKPLDGTNFLGSVESLPLWEKDEYVVFFEGGFSVIGNTIVRKVIRRAGDRKGQALPRFSHVN